MQSPKEEAKVCIEAAKKNSAGLFDKLRDQLKSKGKLTDGVNIPPEVEKARPDLSADANIYPMY